MKNSDIFLLVIFTIGLYIALPIAYSVTSSSDNPIFALKTGAIRFVPLSMLPDSNPVNTTIMKESYQNYRFYIQAMLDQLLIDYEDILEEYDNPRKSTYNSIKQIIYCIDETKSPDIDDEVKKTYFNSLHKIKKYSTFMRKAESKYIFTPQNCTTIINN